MKNFCQTCKHEISQHKGNYSSCSEHRCGCKAFKYNKRFNKFEPCRSCGHHRGEHKEGVHSCWACSCNGFKSVDLLDKFYPCKNNKCNHGRQRHMNDASCSACSCDAYTSPVPQKGICPHCNHGNWIHISTNTGRVFSRCKKCGCVPEDKNSGKSGEKDKAPKSSLKPPVTSRRSRNNNQSLSAVSNFGKAAFQNAGSSIAHGSASLAQSPGFLFTFSYLLLPTALFLYGRIEFINDRSFKLSDLILAFIFALPIFFTYIANPKISSRFIIIRILRIISLIIFWFMSSIFLSAFLMNTFSDSTAFFIGVTLCTYITYIINKKIRL